MLAENHTTTKLTNDTKHTKKSHSFSCVPVLVLFVCFVGCVLVASSQRDVRGADVERGKQIFMRVGCYQCHGREAQGASTGPRLGPNPLPLPAFARAVRTPRNEMPPYSLKLLSDADLADVHAFVAARPRPHQLPR
jgi:ubiquinol-cytochrome c reductase cytochrome c subunit